MSIMSISTSVSNVHSHRSHSSVATHNQRASMSCGVLGLECFDLSARNIAMAGITALVIFVAAGFFGVGGQLTLNAATVGMCLVGGVVSVAAANVAYQVISALFFGLRGGF